MTVRDVKKEIRGIIFDLDGTLLEAYEAIYLGMGEVFRTFGKPLFPPGDLRRHLKADLQATLAPFLSPEETSKAISIFRKRYEEVYLEKTHFLDGAKEILNSLHRQGMVLAVASNKLGLFSRKVLAHLGVAGYFQSILGAGDGHRNKPFPDMIQASLKEMELPPEEVVFVGDSLEDIQAGREAGVDVYALPTGVHSKEELATGRPKRILRSLEDLIPLVQRSKQPLPSS
ncbi:MAG: HAD family hydrolase [Deltaproteobacteria bacterium]|nr:MAG: HAD family hydrolase [Deltaproteobacteria bacterium]